MLNERRLVSTMVTLPKNYQKRPRWPIYNFCSKFRRRTHFRVLNNCASYYTKLFHSLHFNVWTMEIWRFSFSVNLQFLPARNYLILHFLRFETRNLSSIRRQKSRCSWTIAIRGGRSASFRRPKQRHRQRRQICTHARTYACNWDNFAALIFIVTFENSAFSVIHYEISDLARIKDTLILLLPQGWNSTLESGASACVFDFSARNCKSSGNAIALWRFKVEFLRSFRQEWFHFASFRFYVTLNWKSWAYKGCPVWNVLRLNYSRCGRKCFE